jgi:hypothetical protein
MSLLYDSLPEGTLISGKFARLPHRQAGCASPAEPYKRAASAVALNKGAMLLSFVLAMTNWLLRSFLAASPFVVSLLAYAPPP